MYLSVRRQSSRRRGMTIVQTALVLSIALVLIFSVYEYGRLLMMKHIMENAAREGARFAVAHTNDMTKADIEAEITKFLHGFDKQLIGFEINIKAKVLRGGGANGDKGTALATWTDAAYTDGIIVEIKGNYKADLPTLQFLPNAFGAGGSPSPGGDGVFVMGWLPNTIPLRAQSVMYSEGN